MRNTFTCVHQTTYSHPLHVDFSFSYKSLWKIEIWRDFLADITNESFTAMRKPATGIPKIYKPIKPSKLVLMSNWMSREKYEKQSLEQLKHDQEGQNISTTNKNNEDKNESVKIVPYHQTPIVNYLKLTWFIDRFNRGITFSWA